MGLMGLMGLTGKMGRLRDRDSERGSFHGRKGKDFCQGGKNVFPSKGRMFFLVKKKKRKRYLQKENSSTVLGKIIIGTGVLIGVLKLYLYGTSIQESICINHS